MYWSLVAIARAEPGMPAGRVKSGRDNEGLVTVVTVLGCAKAADIPAAQKTATAANSRVACIGVAIGLPPAKSSALIGDVLIILVPDLIHQVQQTLIRSPRIWGVAMVLPLSAANFEW
jgi:hypothetical protein